MYLLKINSSSIFKPSHLIKVIDTKRLSFDFLDIVLF